MKLVEQFSLFHSVALYVILISVYRRPSDMPRLYINRRTAMEHRCDPAHDPDFKNSIFSQIYEALKPRDSSTKCLDYRYGHHNFKLCNDKSLIFKKF